MRQPILLFLFTLFIQQTGHGQDPMFTRFDRMLMPINPAFTGEIPDGYRMRVTAQHRQQWYDALSDPYSHAMVAFEQSNHICQGPQNLLTISPGVYVQTERVLADRQNPTLAFTKLGLNTAIRKSLGEKMHLTVGGELEFLQLRLVGAQALRFGSQFDGMGGFDPNSMSQDPGLSNAGMQSKWRPDFGVGLAYSFYHKKAVALQVGGAIHHLRRSNLSLLGEAEDFDAALSRRHTVFLRMKSALKDWNNNSDNFSEIQLRALFVQQGQGIWQTNVGLEIGHRSGDKYIAIGPGLRLTNSGPITNDLITDIYGTFKLSWEKFTLDFAVDLAHSAFAGLNNDGTATAMELALGYRFQHVKDKGCQGVPCPNF